MHKKIGQKMNTQTHIPKPFQPLWASSFLMDEARPSIFNTRLYVVARMIVSKFHGNQSHQTKVIAWKHIKITIFSPFG